MLQIPCPHCGPRPEPEFTFGGSSHVRRPTLDENASDAAWGDYLFFRDNPRGAHAECWRHTYGCSEWFNIVRDTVTHEVTAVYTMDAPRPGGAAA
ncbi:MAG: sarcosine oxidase subunit delta [Burkholderiales bacterium]|nr:sarcosine oxidase subunit delta [Burkholderiales bacterium]